MFLAHLLRRFTNQEFLQNPFLADEGWSYLPLLCLLLILILGSAYAIVTPPFQVPDEFAHFFRSYGVSEGYLVAPKETPVPVSVLKLTQQFPIHLEQIRKVSASEIEVALHQPLSAQQSVGVRNEGMNLYFWFCYLPSASAIFVGRLLGLAPMALLYLGRFGDLAAYGLLIWFALKLLPAFWPVFMSVALTPMVLHQAGSLSWDGVNFGMAIAFCALIARLSLVESLRPLTLTERNLLLLLVAVLTLCKLDLALLPLLLMIPASRFGSRRVYLMTLVSWFLVAAGSAAVWQYLNRDNYTLFQLATARRNIDFPHNIHYLYYNAGYFINGLFRTAYLNSSTYLNQFVGTFGWLAVPLPLWSVWIYFCLLIFLGLTSGGGMRLKLRQKLLMALVVLAGCAFIVAAMWMAETPEPYIHDVILKDFGAFPGIQGRHFVPFAVPALLLLSNRLRLKLSLTLPFLFAVVLLVNVVALAEIKNAYYSSASPGVQPSSSAPYENKLVRMPGNSPEESKVYIVSDGKRHWIVNAKWITDHHYRWPDDVLTIPKDDLTAIPLGEPIP